MNEPTQTKEQFLDYFKAAERIYVSACEFVRDWKKGDFELPPLAKCDAESLIEALTKYEEAKAILNK